LSSIVHRVGLSEQNINLFLLESDVDEEKLSTSPLSILAAQVMATAKANIDAPS
jgi:hypothetical protein